MEEEGQQQFQGFQFPVPRRTESDKTTRWKIDPDDVIDDIIHYLRGDAFDDQEKMWKAQGYVYHFKISAPAWIHHSLMELEPQNLARYDLATFDKATGYGLYSVFDETSFRNISMLLESHSKTIANTKYAEGVQKEKLDYSFEKEEPQRLVNETGLRVIASRLRGYLNKNIRMGKMPMSMINKIAMDNSINMVKLMFTSYESFNIKKEHLSTIIDIIDVNVYAMLTSTEEGFFVHHLSTTERHIEHENVTMQDKPLPKKGILPNFFGNWGGKE